MRKIIRTWVFRIIPMAAVFGLAFCSTNRGTIDAWEDAALVSRQRAEIEQLRRDITGLRTQLENAQQLTQSGIESINRAYTELESSLSRSTNLQTTIDLLTEFARQCLTEINRLREYQPENTGVQSTNRGTDAKCR